MTNAPDASCNQEEEERKKKGDKAIANAGLAGAADEVVQRYGSANKEHFVGYSGQDNETGQKLAKGLKSISKHRADNPEYRDSNIKQQAGYSAEVKTVARENAEKIITGNAKTKFTRTDDMIKQPDGKGHTIGGKNEQLYDVAEIDKNGIYVNGTGRQLKYVGNTPKECVDRLLNKKFDKYRDAGVEIEIPSDFYNGVDGVDNGQSVQQLLDKRASDLRGQIEECERFCSCSFRNEHYMTT
ncbi:MAG: hypothetical protein LBJ64_05095 [Deltaproteobacteria bacterium]|jgi:hypothetical protein|nr:hypothetical protein [Deltaproteobacteria bacterium]